VDRRYRRLSLARDRLGEKPLYYGWVGSTFLFGSELKALTAYPGFPAEVDRRGARPVPVPAVQVHPRALEHLERHPQVASGPLSRIRRRRAARQRTRCYWTFPHWPSAAFATRLPAGPGTRERLDALLRDAVARRMIADVPLGALLSGGTDSSTVVALMQAQSGQPVKTFSIGFAEKSHDEAPHARAVAEHLAPNIPTSASRQPGPRRGSRTAALLG